MSTPLTIPATGLPATINNGAANTVWIRNTGTVQVIVGSGTQSVIVWPGRCTAISPAGSAITGRVTTNTLAASNVAGKVEYAVDTPDRIAGFSQSDRKVEVEVEGSAFL